MKGRSQKISSEGATYKEEFSLVYPCSYLHFFLNCYFKEFNHFNLTEYLKTLSLY